MDKGNLEALLERVERAEGPDRGIDAAIAVATQYDLPSPMGEG